MVTKQQTAECPHSYKLDPRGHGFCIFCNREVHFDSSGTGPMQVIKEGVPPVNQTETKSKHPHKIKMNKELKAELLEIGPQAFAAKHGYTSRAHSLFSQMYRKLGGELPAKTLAPSTPQKSKTRRGNNQQALHEILHKGPAPQENTTQHIYLAFQNVTKPNRVIIEFNTD